MAAPHDAEAVKRQLQGKPAPCQGSRWTGRQPGRSALLMFELLRLLNAAEEAEMLRQAGFQDVARADWTAALQWRILKLQLH